MGFDTLRISSSGLLAAQKAMEITSNNVANAGNDKYSRQRVNLGALAAYNGSPSGVNVIGVDRMRDVFADATWRAEAGTSAAYEARAGALGRAEDSLGTTSDGLASVLDEFYRSWNTLSLSPGDPAARQSVVYKAISLTSDINRLDQDISAEVTNSFTFAAATLEEVNMLLGEVSALNAAVKQAENSGSAFNELSDSRDAVFDRLSQLAGARVITGASGQPEAVIGGLVATRGDYHSTLEVRGIGTAADPMRLGVVGGSDIDVQYGKLGGMVSAVNTDLAGLRTRLDATAMAIKTQFNTAHQAGFDIAGNPGGVLFSGTTASDFGLDAAITGDMLAASSTATGLGGNGNNALTIADLANDTSSTGSVGMVRTYTVTLGAAVDAARRVASVSDDVLAGTSAARQEAQGVNIDEEMVDLIRYQRAFQASAQAVSIANEVLDTLINRMMR